MQYRVTRYMSDGFTTACKIFDDIEPAIYYARQQQDLIEYDESVRIELIGWEINAIQNI